MNWYHKLGLETSFFYDLPNFLICVLVVIIVSNLVKLPRNYSILLLAHCAVPFIINDVLFSTSYMPDQFKYIDGVRSIRSEGELLNYSANVTNASWFLALIPLPFVETTQSLGFFNKLIFILLFVFLYTKGILTKFSAYFFLLYPSLILYTGMSLRDTLIFACMMLTGYFAVRRNVLLMLVCISPLFFVKFQNFFIMLPLFIYAIFNLGEKGMSIQKGILILVISFVVLIVSFPIVAPILNTFRLAMYKEDGGLDMSEVTLINGIGDFVTLGFTSGLYFLAKPLPWEASKALQLVQALENLIIMFIVIKLTVRAWRTNLNKLIFWLVLFIASLSIYGLVVFNYGTAARYRFPFITMYVVFVSYVCNIKGIFGKKNAS